MQLYLKDGPQAQKKKMGKKKKMRRAIAPQPFHCVSQHVGTLIKENRKYTTGTVVLEKASITMV